MQRVAKEREARRQLAAQAQAHMEAERIQRERATVDAIEGIKPWRRPPQLRRPSASGWQRNASTG